MDELNTTWQSVNMELLNKVDKQIITNNQLGGEGCSGCSREFIVV